MYKATFDSFEAYGETETVALAVLKLGLHRHAKQYNLDADWWHEYADEIHTSEFHCGSCYQDQKSIPQT